MIEVDGKRYVTVEDFDNAVEEEIHQIATICAKGVVDNCSVETLSRAIELSQIVSEAYCNLRIELFKNEGIENAGISD